MLKKKVRSKQFSGYLLLESGISLALLTFLVVTIVPMLLFINDQRERMWGKMELSRFLFEESELARRNKPLLKEKKSGIFLMNGEFSSNKNKEMTLSVRGKDKNMVVISEGKK